VECTCHAQYGSVPLNIENGTKEAKNLYKALNSDFLSERRHKYTHGTGEHGLTEVYAQNYFIRDQLTKDSRIRTLYQK
jgi:hypothetical protein